MVIFKSNSIIFIFSCKIKLWCGPDDQALLAVANSGEDVAGAICVHEPKVRKKGKSKYQIIKLQSEK